MTSEPDIEILDSTDIERITFLDDALRHAVSTQRGGEAWLTEHPSIVEFGVDPALRIFVAKYDGQIMGFLCAFEREIRLRGKVFIVDRVFVDPLAREIGCGDGLLEAAIHHAQNHGCSAIEGIALPGDRETKNLFERAGITARKIVVSKSLSGPSTQAHASR